MKYGWLKALVVVGALAVPSFSSYASGEYVRFWRGEMRSDISQEDFVAGLNHGLFPATAELAKGESKLLSYQPVLASDLARGANIPAEVALLQYESESTYKTFRQTAEGIHYGNMHWNYFQKDSSKSLVVEPWTGSVEIEKAYFLGQMGVAWNQGLTTYRAFARSAGMTDESYLESVNNYLVGTKGESNRSSVVLVAQNYVLEYVHQLNESESIFNLGLDSLQSTVLSKSKLVDEKILGLTYPVRESTEGIEVRATWRRHIEAWQQKNIESILADYDADSVVILNDEIYRGRDQIGKLFNKLFKVFEVAKQSRIYRIVIERDAVYLLWDVTVVKADEKTFSGTDSFFIQAGRIKVQTITVDPTFFSF